MDIRTDSVNDILCHYGIIPGTGREYINGIIAHGTGGFTQREEELYETERNIERREQRKNVKAYIKKYQNYVDDVWILNKSYKAYESIYNATSDAQKEVQKAENSRGGSTKLQALESKFKSLKSDCIRSKNEYAEKYKAFKQKYDRNKMEVERAYYYDLYGNEYVDLEPGKLSQWDRYIIMPDPFDRFR